MGVIPKVELAAGRLVVVGAAATAAVVRRAAGVVVTREAVGDTTKLHDTTMPA